MLKNPKSVRIYSRDEYKQYHMKEELSHNYKLSQIQFMLGDVRDKERLCQAMRDIDYVFHLASLKQVPSCEYDPYEAVKTNILGTQNVVETAIQNKVERVVYTSSDKAANPTSAMGASKLLAERIISTANQYTRCDSTIFSSVRFGNVLSSRGSVIPLFLRQIKNNEPTTITSPDMTRFFMSKRQAVDLVISVCEKAIGGETYVLKMPVFNIEDLASALKKIIGLKTPSVVIGLRSGEKMHEELMTFEESTVALETKDAFIILPNSITTDKAYELFPDSRKAKQNEYRTDNEKKLTIEQIIKMLEDEQIIKNNSRQKKH